MIDAADRLLQLVRSSRSVLLTGPEGPDGDSIGAALALRRILSQLAPGVDVRVAGSPGHRYAFLPDAETMLPDASVAGHTTSASADGASAPSVGFEGVVVLDGDRKRLVAPIAKVFDAARWTGLIDHHRSTEIAPYTVPLFDPSAESTCGMVAALAARWGVALDRPLAELLYTGVIFDTGGFRYSNTHASTHRLAAELLDTGIDHAQLMLRVLVERRVSAMRLLASILADASLLAEGRVAVGVCTRARLEALGADESDLEGIVDLLQHTEGVELAVIVVEKGTDRVKLSLRSRGRVDVAAFAHSLHEGGGGHAKAAGVVLAGRLAELLPWIQEQVVAAVQAGSAG